MNTDTTPPPLLLDIAAAAIVLNVSVGWLRKETQARTIPHTRLGANVRFSAADLAAIVAMHAQPVIVGVTA